MKKYVFLFFYISLLFLTSCKNSKFNKFSLEKNTKITNLLSDYTPIDKDGNVNAIIEIPSGTVEKWELNKFNGQIELELIDNKPRIIDYLGYPGNYGLIPKTLLPKEKGGDGDPLDILVIGPPVERGSIIKCKIIGVLFLIDQEEKDDKLIAVSLNSSLNEINDLNKNYNGISEIINLWFLNYKGQNKMESNGFGDKDFAEEVLMNAINEYELYNNHKTK